MSSQTLRVDPNQEATGVAIYVDPLWEEQQKVDKCESESRSGSNCKS